MSVKSRNNERKIEAKYSVMEPHLHGKVLHIGCIGPGVDESLDWFHRWLGTQAEEIVGIDLDEEGIERAREEGYDCRVEDAQDFDLGEEFDTVVAANVIEHLNCPGNMIDSAKDHLTDEGQLVITTPRTFTPQNLLRELHGGIDPNHDHVAWYCKETLRHLLNRYELEMTAYEAWGFDRVGVTPLDRAWRQVERILARVPGLEKIDKYQHLVVAQ
ncbi:class I SAM-dependent methyltransferase [Haloplanus sp. C73]|uniref:class I SAM-dependent methyltransferase n=1 Tax=Haloplanus sp. C73 TaxID=3421641 RepID=UPI003EB9AF2A